VSKEIESYNANGAGGGKSKEGMTELSGITGDDKNTYTKGKVTIRRLPNEVTTRTVKTAPEIKRVSCSVMVDGIKDPEMLARLKSYVEGVVGFDSSRNDRVEVVNFPITNNQMIAGGNGMAAGYAPAANWPEHRRTSAGIPVWVAAIIGIPFLIILLFGAMFLAKQKNVQRDKQRLILSSGPGATVSDISDLLADKEGKITTPRDTKVNTTDQLENLAKEKPTKVAELLKSTWLADR
jgi:flagellar biosynthesis/type III secretory pathway M-ring protein FliF/YscJ